MNSAGRLFWPLICWLITAALAVPLVAVLWSVTRDSEGVWQHLAETVLTGYVKNTLILAAGVGVGTALIGVTCAWLLTYHSFPLAGVFRWSLLLPLAIPTYLTAYALTDLFQFSGPIQSWIRDTTGWGRDDYWFPEVRSLTGAIGILTLGLFPYVFLAARTGFASQSASVVEAGRTLGAGSWQIFFRIALPLARPSVFAGLALVLMETLAEFGTVDYCAVDTFSTGIYRTWMSRGSLTAASQLSACLLSVAGLLYAAEFLSRRSARFHHATQRTQPLPRTTLSGLKKWIATGVCAIPVLVGFALPVARFIQLTIKAGDERAMELVWELGENSLLVASIAAGMTVTTGMFLAYVRRGSQSRITRAAVQGAGLGYAIPGGVIAIGILGPLWWLEDGILTFLETRTDWDFGLFLSGTIVAVLIGYQVRFLALPLNVIGAGFARIRPTVDDAARNLGASRFGLLWRVHLPLLRGSLLSAALLVFVDVLKELPATLILRPFNFDTLAVRVHNLAADERLSEASTCALAIIATGLVPVALLASRNLNPVPSQSTVQQPLTVQNSNRESR